MVEGASRALPRPLRTVVHPNSETSLAVETSGPTAQRDPRPNFTFDRVYDADSAQEEIYNNSVEPLIQRFLDGYNTTVFAYGQTSSGKSYTMGTCGESEAYTEDGLADMIHPQVGIIPRAAQRVFASLDESLAESPGAEHSLQVSFLELYNEDLIDLLAEPDIDATNQVQIRETRVGEIVWTGLRQYEANDALDIIELLKCGMDMRQTHETEMNTQSSRSHAIFSLTLTRSRPRAASPERGAPLAIPQTPRASGLPKLGAKSALRTPSRPITPTRTPSRILRARQAEADAVVTTSKLHFVDLAGSERLKRTAATGDRVKEGICINSGLHALGNVISMLSDPAKARRPMHIPYRDSKLTRLLQDSLGGNAHTLMIACVSSLEMNVNETLNTLYYAQRARHIRNSVERNQTEAGWNNVEHLQTQVLRLRKELDLIRVSHELLVAAPEQKGPSLVHSDHAQALLAWQEKYSALSRKNVQLTAELLQLNRQQRPNALPTTPGDFLANAEPVIVEYEKTVDALEGQLNVLKASVAYSEELLKEREQALLLANARATSAENEVDLLRATVRDLHERLDDSVDELESSRRSQHSALGLGRPGAESDALKVSTLERVQRACSGMLGYKSRTVSSQSQATEDAPDTTALSALLVGDTSENSMLLGPGGKEDVEQEGERLRLLNRLLEPGINARESNLRGSLLHWVQSQDNSVTDEVQCRTCGL
ncbi:hypothetical protein MVES_000882 [Malassezia vespertilionis]|uniref:Kinesin-like protein n=2 Tax=Malassezia vespertilionis TaxID=2020962 RepID=A0A2N1JF53_9BASI|nr:hypothetical protein MVES_000882 [Malassezia vespertilionis]